jgi:CBS domain containing-hemolysin-like protein
MTAADAAIFVSITFVGVLLSASFSGLETGLYTINRVRLTVRDARGEAAAKTLRRMLANPARMLAVVLVGNNIANYLASYGIAAILDGSGMAPAQAILINAAVLIPVLFVLGEILPKDLFRTHTDRWSYALAGYLKWTGRVLLWIGLVPVVEHVGRIASRLLGGNPDAGNPARQRVSRLIKEGMGAGVLSEVQTTLADRALALRDLRVVDEMIPWSDVATVSADLDGAALREALRHRNFTRLPAVDGDRVVGVLSVIDALLQPETPVRDLMTEPLGLRPGMPVHTALRAMRTSRTALAVVTAADSGRPLGLVTMKDLVEPLTGDLTVW